MSPSLNRDQRERLELLGRTSAPTRYAERTDANRIRVVAIDFGGVKMGQCADSEGNLLPSSCSYPDSGECSDDGHSLSGDGYERWNPPEIGSVRPSASAKSYGMFRQYSTQVGTSVETANAVGPVGVNGKVYHARNFLVLEWRRYGLTQICEEYSGRSHVSAIERGIAVRIIFDVKLTTVDAKFTASFGIADLSTVLARNEATVEVSYEIRGTTLDPLPNDAIVVTSLTEYLDTVDAFFSAVNMISRAIQHHQMKAGEPSHDFNINDGTSLPPKPIKIDKDTFSDDVLAYYVSGQNVGDHFAALSNVEECKAVTSKHKYLLDDIVWVRAVIAAYEAKRDRKRSFAENVQLRQAKFDIESLRLERRSLAATSAQLSCEQACAAESKRIESQEEDTISQLEQTIFFGQREMERLGDIDELKRAAEGVRSEAEKANDLWEKAEMSARKVREETLLARLRADREPEDRSLNRAADEAEGNLKVAEQDAQSKLDAWKTVRKPIDDYEWYMDQKNLVDSADKQKKEIEERRSKDAKDAVAWCKPVRLNCGSGEGIEAIENVCVKMWRDVAPEEGKAAEESRKAAKESKMEAEESKKAAEESRKAAEKSRKAAEESRKAAEESRKAAEAANESKNQQ